MVSINSGGSLQLPLALLLLVLTTGSVGNWVLLHSWRNQVKLQLRLDRCVGEMTLALKKHFEKIHQTNLQITALRASILAAQAIPSTLPPLQSGLQAMVLLQDSLRVHWEIQRDLWISRQKCGSLADLPHPLPRLDWIRDPADGIGPQPLRWQGTFPKDFQIELGHPPRHAAARLSSNGGPYESQASWHAEWTAPRFAFHIWPSLH